MQHLTSSDVRYQLHESPLRAMVTPSRHSVLHTIGQSRHCIKGRIDASFRHKTIFFSLYLTKTNQKPKMGAEKVTMNIVIVGQVQSLKAIKSVAKAIPATSQLMISNIKVWGFVELEVVLNDNQTVEDGQSIVEDLMSHMGVEEKDLISVAYVNMLVQNKS
ncbi:hypothetical protein QTP88_027308 [Uroleucon formosanum]